MSAVVKKAYLITAYHQPTYLARLVSALRHPSVKIYIHVDAKALIEPFLAAVPLQEGVAYVKRHRVNWMGFSQVESILTLMRAAMQDGCEYLSLISGSDYPIKPTNQIVDFFANANEEFITFWRLVDRPSWLDKVRYYYPIDWVPIRSYETAGFRRYWWGYYYKLRHYMPPRNALPGFDFYGGSDWWSISANCAKYVLDFVEANTRFVRFYRYTHCPSEMFFHTIIMNSPFRARVRNATEYDLWRTRRDQGEVEMIPEHLFNLRHIDWSGERTGERECPAVLDERDIDVLRAVPDLFARKFELPRSSKILDMVDAELRCL